MSQPVAFMHLKASPYTVLQLISLKLVLNYSHFFHPPFSRSCCDVTPKPERVGALLAIVKAELNYFHISNIKNLIAYGPNNPRI